MTEQVYMALSSTDDCVSKSFIDSKGLSGRSRLLFFVFSLTYGFTLSQIPNENFIDFGNYLVGAENSLLTLLAYAERGVLSVLMNEPLWFLGNAFIALFLQPTEVLRTIIFLSASSVAYSMLRANPNNASWLLVFLILPIVLKNHLVHLRQGAAIAIFLIGWFSSRKNWRYFIIGLAPLIHSSFFIVIAILILTRVMQSVKLGADIRSIVFILFGISVGFSIFFVVDLVGARQANEYVFSKTDVSGLAFFFWSVICGLMLSQGRTFLRNYAFEVGCILFYLSTYFLIEITGRIFESTLLLVLIAGLALKGWRLRVFQSSIIAYGALMWLMRAGDPAFGFSIA